MAIFSETPSEKLADYNYSLQIIAEKLSEAVDALDDAMAVCEDLHGKDSAKYEMLQEMSDKAFASYARIKTELVGIEFDT